MINIIFPAAAAGPAMESITELVTVLVMAASLVALIAMVAEIMSGYVQGKSGKDIINNFADEDAETAKRFGNGIKTAFRKIIRKFGRK